MSNCTCPHHYPETETMEQCVCQHCKSSSTKERILEHCDQCPECGRGQCAVRHRPIWTTHKAKERTYHCKPASPGVEDSILQILMRYENPIPVGMDTSKGSIELDHNETVRHLKSFISNLLSSERQSLYSLILKEMPEKQDGGADGSVELLKGYNAAVADTHEALSEIFEERREE